MRLSDHTLVLRGTDLASKGQDFSGLRVFCAALGDATQGAGLTALDLGHNKLGVGGAEILGEALKGNKTLKSLGYMASLSIKACTVVGFYMTDQFSAGQLCGQF